MEEIGKSGIPAGKSRGFAGSRGQKDAGQKACPA